MAIPDMGLVAQEAKQKGVSSPPPINILEGKVALITGAALGAIEQEQKRKPR